MKNERKKSKGPIFVSCCIVFLGLTWMYSDYQSLQAGDLVRGRNGWVSPQTGITAGLLTTAIGCYGLFRSIKEHEEKK